MGEDPSPSCPPDSFRDRLSHSAYRSPSLYPPSLPQSLSLSNASHIPPFPMAAKDDRILKILDDLVDTLSWSKHSRRCPLKADHVVSFNCGEDHSTLDCVGRAYESVCISLLNPER